MSYWPYSKPMQFEVGEGVGPTTYNTSWAPAIAEHDGLLWCLFANKGDANRLCWSVIETIGPNVLDQVWSSPAAFADGVVPVDRPALADDGDVLHAVIVVNVNGQRELVHYQWDDQAWRWRKRCGVVQQCGSSAGIAGLNGQLFCAFVPAGAGGAIYYTVWNPDDGWRPVKSVGEACWGTPALYQVDGRLHLSFAANNDNRDIIDSVYDESSDSWKRSSAQPKEKADTHVAATATLGTAIPGQANIGFLKRNGGGLVLVSTYTNGVWYQNQDIGGAFSLDAPSLAILDNTVACAWPNKNANGQLWCTQTPVGPPLTLDRWMSNIIDGVHLTYLSIPGTHDTCAISVLAYKGVQNMSVREQLDAGIRFIDLRCGLDNGLLYMYHGETIFGPLYDDNLKQVKLTDVLGQIYQWLNEHTTEAVVVSIKQDPDPVNSPNTTFDAAVYDLIGDPQKPESAYWHLADDNPILHDIRGHLVLIRRYSAPEGQTAIGINVYGQWPGNSTGTFTAPGGLIFTVQDYYDIPSGTLDSIGAKWNYVRPTLQDAGRNGDYRHWYVSFGSAVCYPFGTPVYIASGGYLGWVLTPGINSMIRDWISSSGPQEGLGVIAMDVPELPNGDLIATIVQSNKQFFTKPQQS